MNNLLLAKQDKETDVAARRRDYEVVSAELQRLKEELQLAQEDLELLPAQREQATTDHRAAALRLQECERAARRNIGRANAAFYNEQLRLAQSQEQSAATQLASFKSLDLAALQATIKTLQAQIDKKNQELAAAQRRLDEVEQIAGRAATARVLEAYLAFLGVLEVDGCAFAKQVNGSLWWELQRIMADSNTWAAMLSPDFPGSTKPSGTLTRNQARLQDILKNFQA